MTKRIFHSICLVAIVVFLATMLFIMGVLYNYFSGIQHRQLKIETELAAHGVELEGIDYLNKLEAVDYRVTWISASGEVIYDSQSDATDMENHLDREEVIQAIEQGYGESVRYSSTLTETLLYSAIQLDDGSVLRLSSGHYSVLALTLGMVQPILVVFAIAVVLSLVLAYRLSKKIVRPLNELNLDEPLTNEDYDELSPLLRRIDSQQREIKAQTRELERKRNEFEIVTGNLTEGFILLDLKGTILSINRAAARLMNADDKKCLGTDILAINRSLELQDLVRDSRNGKRAECIMHIFGGDYQVDASPVISDGTVYGCVLLLFDVTERERAEQMRREFTANVSHELKTPLHSISGCAELLSNGMVKAGDVKQFSGQIYSEAQRMIRLVDDIIHLSRLDEGAGDMKRESVDLYEIASDMLKSLKTEADEAGVTLELAGAPAFMTGIPQLLRGIAYNLIDNAIKYNHSGGRARIEVRDIGDSVKLEVSDTGIGIPVEYQARVFERFYRVDKSHSKEVGGTGLGLSIVKHAAQIHNARVELDSKPEHGTRIKIIFPKVY